MKIAIGVLLFIILNIILIPASSIFSTGFWFYLGTLLTLMQIIVGFSVVYGIMYSKLKEYRGDN